MIEKSPLCPERVRKITGSFAFLEHRFLALYQHSCHQPQSNVSQSIPLHTSRTVML
jgi:hypothetical protein